LSIKTGAVVHLLLLLQQQQLLYVSLSHFLTLVLSLSLSPQNVDVLVDIKNYSVLFLVVLHLSRSLSRSL